jgi:uncharacterized protein
MNRSWFTVLWVFWAAVLAADAWGAFDCSRAKTNVEKLLCSSEKLAAADERMAQAFRAAFYRSTDRPRLLEAQRSWQLVRRDTCLDVPCLLQAYKARIEELED